MYIIYIFIHTYVCVFCSLMAQKKYFKQINIAFKKFVEIHPQNIVLFLVFKVL